MYITQWDIHFLSCPLPFKEDCNADGEGIWQFPARLQWSNSHTDNSLSPVRSRRELMRCLVFCGGFQVAKNTRRQARRCPFLLNRGGDAHKGRKRLTQKKPTGYDKWRCLRLASKIHHSCVSHTFSLTSGLILKSNCSCLCSCYTMYNMMDLNTKKCKKCRDNSSASKEIKILKEKCVNSDMSACERYSC